MKDSREGETALSPYGGAVKRRQRYDHETNIRGISPKGLRMGWGGEKRQKLDRKKGSSGARRQSNENKEGEEIYVTIRNPKTGRNG